jgi:predicted nucleotidyltransferase
MNLRDDVLKAVVREQTHPLLFAVISGAHLYGFPSPDSDYDVRGVHILPVREVIGLYEPKSALHQSQVRDGIEIDWVTYEVREFFIMLLRRDGNVMEQVFSPLVLQTTPEHEELKSIAQICVTKHHVHHYLGFVRHKWKDFESETPRRVKPLLYVYRILLTGIHLMRTGVVEANLLTLNAEYRLPYVDDLVARKLAGGEHGFLAEVDIDFHRAEMERLTAELEALKTATALPDNPAGKAALNDLLIRLRLRTI